MKKRKSTLIKLILFMMSLVTISLLVTTVFMRGYIKDREEEIIRQRISSTAKIIAMDKSVQETVKNKNQEKFIQEYTLKAMKETRTDFIVVTDKDFVRYSHPKEELIGNKFSSIQDIEATFTEGDHFSKQTGTLGEGIRYFTALCRVYKKNSRKPNFRSTEKLIFLIINWTWCSSNFIILI